MNNYNFYQSPLWQHINNNIFQKPAFQVEFDWNVFQVICKEKKIFWIVVVWFQLLWIQYLDKKWLNELKTEVLSKAKAYYDGRRYIALFIQLGFADIIMENNVADIKKQEDILSDAFQIIKKSYDNDKLSLWLRPSKKRNLPDATITVDLYKTTQDIWNNMGKNTKEKIKKAERLISNWTLLCEQTQEENWYDDFFQLYRKTADTKWFGAITPRMRSRLKLEALQKWYGKLFVVKTTQTSSQTEELVSGALCLQDGDNLIYLYGANDRRYGNSGVSQYLHWKIIQYAQEAGLRTYDLLWASWLWAQHDRLEKVTQFKMGLGDSKIEYGWSRDLVLSRVWYFIYSKF